MVIYTQWRYLESGYDVRRCHRMPYPCQNSSISTVLTQWITPRATDMLSMNRKIDMMVDYLVAFVCSFYYDQRHLFIQCFTCHDLHGIIVLLL